VIDRMGGMTINSGRWSADLGEFNCKLQCHIANIVPWGDESRKTVEALVVLFGTPNWGRH